MEDMSSGIAEIQPLSPEKKQEDTNARQEFETTAGEGLRNRKHAPTSDDSGCNLDVSGSSITKKDEPTPTVFFFWAFFVGIISIVTLAFVIFSSLITPGDEKTEFLSMPPDLRSHYSKGKMIKVRIGYERNYIQMFVRDEGPRDHAETVVLVHGFGGSSYSFRNVLSMLASRGIRAVAPDLPGFGFSDKTSLQNDREWPGFIGRVRDVYLEIKEKGLFSAFDQLIETGEMPYQEPYRKTRVTQSHQVMQCGAEELGRSLGQVVESLALGPVHLVLHDTGFESGAVWAASNPSLVRSITLIDATPHSPSVPLWILKVPGLSGVVTQLSFLQLGLFKTCCSRVIDTSAAEAHGFLLRTKNAAKAIVEITSRANFSFDFEAWANADQIKEVPIKILWANDWSKDWLREGHLISQQLPRAEFVSHSGGRWPQRYSTTSKQRLDRAILTFFQHFRKSYVGDQAMHSSKVMRSSWEEDTIFLLALFHPILKCGTKLQQLYSRLSELLGLQDHLMVLNVIVSKIATNLKCYTQSEDVIEHTLALFLELASG